MNDEIENVAIVEDITEDKSEGNQNDISIVDKNHVDTMISFIGGEDCYIRVSKFIPNTDGKLVEKRYLVRLDNALCIYKDNSSIQQTNPVKFPLVKENKSEK